MRPLSFFLFLGVFMLGCTGTRPLSLGIKEGKLAPCPSTPNCVSSQSNDKEHAIEPLVYNGDAKVSMARLARIVRDMPRAQIINEQDDYLYVEFTSLVFRFVDDVEFFADNSAKRIHVRSASRLGRGDLGVNRKRVETIRNIWNAGTSGTPEHRELNASMTISIIIPVLNEAENINSLIIHLHALDPSGKAEIIVVDGAADSGTIKAIEDKKVVAAVSEPGRGNQMNRGASLAQGDVLLFLHADTLLPADAFALIKNALADKRFVGGAFDLGIGSERKIFRITERYVALRTRLTRVPFGDQAIFLRREHFEKIGGYSSIPVMEDVELMARIRKRGDRICIIPEKVMTSPRRWEKEGVLRTTLRNWMIQLLYILGVPPTRLARFYR